MCKRIHGREERILRAVIPKSRVAIYLSSAIPNGYSIIDSNFHSRRIFAIRCIRNFPPINHARCTIVFYLTTFIPLALNVKHIVPLLMYLSFEVIFAMYMCIHIFSCNFSKIDLYYFIIARYRDKKRKGERSRLGKSNHDISETVRVANQHTSLQVLNVFNFRPISVPTS